MKETSFVICIFMPERLFQAGIWILWVVWSLGAVVSCSAQVTLFIFSLLCMFLSALSAPSSLHRPLQWVQPPVKTHTHHRVVNKLMFELFLWMSEVNEGFLASTNLQFHRDYSPGKVAVEATGSAQGAREFWPCGDLKILPSVGACMHLIPCPRWSFQRGCSWLLLEQQ